MNLPLLKKWLAVPENDSTCNVAFCPQDFFGTGWEKTNMESRRMQINILLGISYQAQNSIEDACFGWPKKATAKHARSPLLYLDPNAKWLSVQCPLPIYSRLTDNICDCHSIKCYFGLWILNFCSNSYILDCTLLTLNPNKQFEIIPYLVLRFKRGLDKFWIFFIFLDILKY